MTMHALCRLFSPKSVVLVGATDRSAWSRNTFANLRSFGFSGPVHLVNPRGGVIHGQQAFTDLADVPGDVDLAFVMVPTHVILATLEHIADRGIRSAVILTAGFSEVGEEGARLEKQLVDRAKERGVVLLGPNGNGFVNLAGGIAPYGLGIPGGISSGAIGVVLHSGGLAGTVLALAEARQAGLSLVVATGNEAMVSLTDVMHYLVEDDATHVIALFVESVRDPAAFLRVARAARERGKPIVALKVGRSEASAQAAKAHTGALVGDDRIVEAVFRSAGVARVRSLEELIVTAALFEAVGEIPGRRLAFVSASGGASEIIADRCADEGLELAQLSGDTRGRLRAALPEFATVNNPIDVTGYVVLDESLPTRAMQIVHDDPDVDAVVLMAELPRTLPGDAAKLLADRTEMADAIRAATKPVVAMAPAHTDITDAGRMVAERSGLPTVMGGIDLTLTAIGHAVRWSERRHAPDVVAPRPTSGHPLPVADDAVGVVGEHRAARLLAERGVRMVPHVVADTAEAAVEAADGFGYPVVVKLVSDRIAHKSDIGGVRLGIGSPAEARDAFEAVVEAGRAGGEPHPAALVQPQRSGGVELVVGIVRDPQWGLALALGAGGIWVEVLDDTVIEMLPVTRPRIIAALQRLRIWPMLAGARGRPAADLDALAQWIEDAARVAESLGDRLESLEINPLSVREDAVEALDALIVWRE